MADFNREDLVAHWEERYASAEQVWSGKVNATLAGALDSLVGVTAVDIACGEGGDALWLASRGWHVTGLDLSATAIRRATERAEREGLSEATAFVAADALAWEPPAAVDLVYSSFLHSALPIDRLAILRKGATWVAPGGHLVILSHAAPPPWSQRLHERAHEFHGAAEQVAALELGDQWNVVTAEDVSRPVVAPDGTDAVLVDALVVLRLTA